MKESFAQIEGFTRFKPPFGVWMMRFEDRVFYESKVYWTDANVFDLFGFDFRLRAGLVVIPMIPWYVAPRGPDES